MQRSLEIKWGVLFTAVGLLWMVFEKIMGWHGPNIDKHALYTNFFTIIAILLYVLALRDKKRSLGGTMTWKQGFFAGMIVTLVVAVLSPLSQYVTHEVISPEYFSNAIDYAVESDLQTRSEAEKYFNLKNYVLQSSIFAVIIGAITSAIVAIFMRSKV